MKTSGSLVAQESDLTGPRSSAFPALLSSYGHRTELLAALSRYGPLRGAELRTAFGSGSANCARKAKSNPANLLVAMTIDNGRNGGAYSIVGLNPKIPTDVYTAITALLARMTAIYHIRPVKADLQPSARALFGEAMHPDVDLDSCFGTSARTRTLLALYVTGGKLELGKLQGSVWEQPKGAILTAVRDLKDIGVLIHDKTVRFDPRCPFLDELNDVLNVLVAHMPEVVRHALRMRDIRSRSKSGTARAHGAEFRLFGPRLSQGILCALAAYGPMRIMQLCKTASARDASCVDPLVESGLVARIPSTSPRRSDLFSLNADHPLYHELRALLRTEPIMSQSLHSARHPLYDGADCVQSRSKYTPNNLFGDKKRDAMTNVLGVLVHTPNQEAEAASLERMLGEHSYSGVREALQRLKEQGIVTRRIWKGLRLYRLSEEWPGHAELRALILSMGRIWPDEFALDGSLERRYFTAHRMARERGRSDPRKPAT